MAASGKKGKKSKGKVLSLNEFLSDDHGGPRVGEAVVMAPSKTSWADEMEEESLFKEKLVLPTAPRAARGSDVDESRIPTNAPYTAYIANLPYDTDTEDVIKFFHGLSVKSVRLPRDGGEGGRLRGFGYAEFETRQDLVEALAMNELLIKNRKIRVDIASGTDGDQEQGGMGTGRGRGRPGRNDEEREDRTPSDWRSAPRDAPPAQERPSFRGGDRDRESGGRYDPGFNPRDRPPGSSFGPKRDGPPSSYGRDRDGPSSFGRDRDGPPAYGRDRDGPPSYSRERDYGRDRDPPSSFGRERDAPSYSRDRDGQTSFGRDRDGPYGRDRDGPSFGRDRDSNYGRDREAPFTRGDRERERPIERDVPKERPKLALKPRSVPVEEVVIEPAVTAAAATGGPSSSSIFGGAQPVDTAARERQIEERLKEKEKEREARSSRGREVDSEEHADRDTSRSSGDHGRSVEAEKGDERKEYDDEHQRSRDRPGPRPHKDGDYRPPRSSGSNEYRPPRDGDYRPPVRSGTNERDYRAPTRDGDYRPPRRDDEPRRENGVSRGQPASGSYRTTSGAARRDGPVSHNDSRPREQDRGDRRSSAPNSSSSKEENIRKLEEPKAPVFENRNKFAYLLPEDEGADESDGRDEQ